MKEVFYLSQWKVTEEKKFPQCVDAGYFKPANLLCELDFQVHEQAALRLFSGFPKGLTGDTED